MALAIEKWSAFTGGSRILVVLSQGYVFINRKNNRGIWFAETEFIL